MVSVAAAPKNNNNNIEYQAVEKNKPSKGEYIESTEFNGIKKSTNDSYAMEVNIESGKIMVPVGRLDIDVTNETSFNEAMQRTDISANAKMAIQESRENFLSTGAASSVTIFSQILLHNNMIDNRTAQLNKSLSFMPMSIIPINWNGIPMAREDVYQSGLNTQYQLVEEGYNTPTTAWNIYDITLTVAGLTNIYVGFIQSGISLLQYFMDLTDVQTVTGSTEDFLQVRMIYNKTTRSTFVVNSDYTLSLGCISKRVTVTNIASEQYYCNNGNGSTESSSRDVSMSQQTENYASPYAEAYWRVSSGLTPLYEDIEWEVGSVTFLF
jgi:hypothetical protein